MKRFRIAQLLCKLLPPLFSNYFRLVIYSFNSAIKDNISFKRKSITGSLFEGNTKDLHAYSFFIHGYYEWRNLLIAHSIVKNVNEPEIIEIGANIGTETIAFADLVGNGYVYAFEPIPKLFKQLNKIKENNNNLNIELFNEALGDSKSTVNFRLPPESYSGMGKIDIHSNADEVDIIQVNVDTLDSHIDSFKAVKAIFIDTEGHEPFVLEGSRNTINKFKPVVILEVSESLLAENDKTSMDIYLFFEEIGYECYNIGRFLLSKVNKELVEKNQRHTNWICIPKDSTKQIVNIKKTLYKHIIFPLNKL